MVLYADYVAWGVLYLSVCAADALREYYVCSSARWEYSYHAARFVHVRHLEKVEVLAFC